MNETLQSGYFGAGAVSEQRNRVLRNTYWLLALSLVPTVLGAWIGVSTGFSFFAGSPFMGFILFMGIAFGFFFAIEKFKNSGIGVALLLGFTFFMGLMLSRLIGAVLGVYLSWSRFRTEAAPDEAARKKNTPNQELQ